MIIARYGCVREAHHLSKIVHAVGEAEQCTAWKRSQVPKPASWGPQQCVVAEVEAARQALARGRHLTPGIDCDGSQVWPKIGDIEDDLGCGTRGQDEKENCETGFRFHGHRFRFVRLTGLFSNESRERSARTRFEREIDARQHTAGNIGRNFGAGSRGEDPNYTVHEITPGIHYRASYFCAL
jgi:hypothetical protein